MQVVDCSNLSFSVTSDRESTGRAVVARELGVVNSYTLEVLSALALSVPNQPYLISILCFRPVWLGVIRESILVCICPYSISWMLVQQWLEFCWMINVWIRVALRLNLMCGFLVRSLAVRCLCVNWVRAAIRAETSSRTHVINLDCEN